MIVGEHVTTMLPILPALDPAVASLHLIAQIRIRIHLQQIETVFPVLRAGGVAPTIGSDGHFACCGGIRVVTQTAGVTVVYRIIARECHDRSITLCHRNLSLYFAAFPMATTHLVI
jgi:hypothetical protein